MRIMVLGAGYAGVACALRLSRERRTQVTLVTRDAHFCERIRLHEQVAHGLAPHQALAELLEGTEVSLTLGQIEHIDLAAQVVRVSGQSLPWDRLVLAMGSRSLLGNTPGVREHAFTLDGSDAARLAQRVPEIAARAGRLLVVGGGLTGVEAATELAERWPTLRVTLLTRGEVADGWSKRGREHVLRTLERLGVELIQHAKVASLSERGAHTDRGVVAYDACLWCVGFEASPIAREAGLQVNALGQVSVDARLRSLSHPHVYAVGDCALPVESVGDPMPMGCKSALPTGFHAANNIARSARGERERPLVFRSPFFCVSLGRNDGLIQGRARDTSLRGRALTGQAAAWFKELVCRSTTWVLRLERQRSAWSRRFGLRTTGEHARLPENVAG
ncbi:MAG: FAD-dependent oxidoreductase [Myxococcales bacterium]